MIVSFLAYTDTGGAEDAVFSVLDRLLIAN
jgi:hypothetical protein